MLMVNPVSVSQSAVRFRGTEGSNVLERQGAYSKPTEAAAPAVEDKPVKKSGHKLRNTVVGLLVAAAGLVALKKTNVLKTLDAAVLADTKFYSPKKIGHYLAVAGDAIAKYTYEPLANLCGKFFGKKAA
ncbi:MAG: hypothetical protein K2F57_05070 [Candidatus Gastranaerophilales bacterium]|nr:hypothetical protein [Candidatus Gastranaerophilales bacterium]